MDRKLKRGFVRHGFVQTIDDIMTMTTWRNVDVLVDHVDQRTHSSRLGVHFDIKQYLICSSDLPRVRRDARIDS